MIVRIRLRRGPYVRRNPRKNQHIALAFASLLTPASLMVCVLGFWQLAADCKFTSKFPIESGFFSHWQVWIVLAGVLQLCAGGLNRYGSRAPSDPACGDSPHPVPDQTAF